MKKYRIKLKNSRVIGPLELDQIIELYAKKHIDATEDCQEFPVGDWIKIKKVPEIASALLQTDGHDATFIKKIESIGHQEEKPEAIVEAQTEVTISNSKIEYPQKFEYEKKTPFSSRSEISEVAEDINEPLVETLEEQAKVETKSVDNKNSVQQINEKTVVNLNTIEYLKQLKIENEKIQEQKRLEEVEEEPPIDLNAEATQFIDLRSLKNEIDNKLEENEAELEDEALSYIKQKQKEEKRARQELEKLKKIQDEQSEFEDEPDEQKAASKKKIVILIAVLAIVLVILFPAEEKKTVKAITPIPPTISFPQRYDVPNKDLAKKQLDEAILILQNPTYPNQLKAAKLLLSSSENQFDDNPALGRLILLYADLLMESSRFMDDANTVFKLIQIFKTKSVSDPLFAAGYSLFYLNIEKASAAVKVIDRFNSVKINKPTLELFAIYLRALLGIGDLIKAKGVAERLAQIEVTKRSLFVDLALIDYYLFINNYEEASLIIASSMKKYPNSVPLLLLRSKLLAYQSDYKAISPILDKIRELGAESSKIYYAKYLEYRALEAVSNNQINKAIEYFKKALKIHESQELRVRLAALAESNNQEANILISESKALQFMASSTSNIKKNNWQFAFKDALEATRIAPHYTPAKLHLARLQIKQSIFAEAISTLENLYKNDPHNDEVVLTLIDAYIESYKYSDVQRLFGLLATSDIRNHPRFFSLTAKYYVFKNEFQNAVNWLQLAINKNPLDDNNIFELAKMFIKYAKYDNAKMLLNRAMDLDPANIDFRIKFSDIVYEVDGSDSAIGYLYDVLQDFPDNPKLLSQIGIFHYRSGQLKSFESIKEKLTKLPHRDTSLYDFLIKAAKLDGKLDLVVANSKKLIEINSGDLSVRLELGKIYMEMDKYKDALIEFKAIEDRLSTYPKLQYFMSKLYLLTDDSAKAIELAQKEIEANPSSEDGYILLGDIYRKEKEYLKAENEYKKAQKINGENVDMLIGLASINFRKSQYEIALDLFLRARKNDPARAETHKLLGDAYRKTSQSTLAIESYKMFLELSPNSKYKDEINTYIRMME
jgi:tetratricopeptide (TPR) repeat protein